MYIYDIYDNFSFLKWTGKKALDIKGTKLEHKK